MALVTIHINNLLKNGDIVKSVNVNKGVEQSINLVYENNSGTLIKKGEDKNVEEIVNIYDNISAPISKGQKLGEVSYTLNGTSVGKTDLIAECDVKKISVSNMLERLFFDWFCVLR